MADLEKIADDLSSLTVLEAAELSKMLEEKWGVSAAAPVAVAGVAAAGGDAGGAAEEQSEFDVILASAGDKKINVIKEVRTITGSRPQGSQGTRRRRAEACEGRRGQGRGRRAEEEAGRGGRDRRAQVALSSTGSARAVHRTPPSPASPDRRPRMAGGDAAMPERRMPGPTFEFGMAL